MDWTSIGPTLGPIAEEFICYAFLFVPDLLLLVRQYFMFWAVWGLFYVYGYVRVRSTSYLQIFVPFGYCVRDIFIKWVLSIYLGRYTFVFIQSLFLSYLKGQLIKILFKNYIYIYKVTLRDNTLVIIYEGFVNTIRNSLNKKLILKIKNSQLQYIKYGY